jgi:hypothetical protein
MAKAKGTLPQANTTRTKLSALDAIDATLQPIGHNRPFAPKSIGLSS